MSTYKRRGEKRNALLGMSYGTARARLERSIMFEMAVCLGRNICYRCSKEIESVSVLSVEHKNSWQLSVDPVSTYFDLGNIAFSHTRCNSNAAQKKRNPHGVAKGRHCKCEPCLLARTKYNAEWMADWRAAGKDKSRINFKGPAEGGIRSLQD